MSTRSCLHFALLTIGIALAYSCLVPSTAQVERDSQFERDSSLRTASTHDDQGFLTLPSGKLIRWSVHDMPIVVYVHPKSGIWLFHALKAAEIWNKALGMDMILVDPKLHKDAGIWAEHSPGVVPILPTNESNPYTHYTADPVTGRTRAAPIYMPTSMLYALMPDGYLLLVHEFGHVLGLTHDPTNPPERPWSIMEPKLMLPVDGDVPPITAHDIGILKKWYLHDGVIEAEDEENSTPPIPTR